MTRRKGDDMIDGCKLSTDDTYMKCVRSSTIVQLVLARSVVRSAVHRTERVRFGLWRESCSILFLKVAKYRSNRKNRCRKNILSHHENTEFKFPVKTHTPCDQFCTCYDQFQSEFIGSIDLLRG